jgi:hypothetical protein
MRVPCMNLEVVVVRVSCKNVEAVVMRVSMSALREA